VGGRIGHFMKERPGRGGFPLGLFSLTGACWQYAPMFFPKSIFSYPVSLGVLEFPRGLIAFLVAAASYTPFKCGSRRNNPFASNDCAFLSLFGGATLFGCCLNMFALFPMGALMVLVVQPSRSLGSCVVLFASCSNQSLT